MFKKLKEQGLLKRWDFILIFCFTLLSFLPLVFFSIQQYQLRESAEEVIYYAVISVDGEEIKRYTLDDEKQRIKYKYVDEDGDYNLIEINGNSVAIVEASCLDQLCVRMGSISKPGQSIVCLPHKLSIEIVASDGSQSGSLIY